MRHLDHVMSEGRPPAAEARNTQYVPRHESILSTAGGRDGVFSSHTEVST